MLSNFGGLILSCEKDVTTPTVRIITAVIIKFFISYLLYLLIISLKNKERCELFTLMK